MFLVRPCSLLLLGILCIHSSGPSLPSAHISELHQLYLKPIMLEFALKLFKNSFRLTEKLRDSTESSHIKNLFLVSPIIISHWDGIFITINEPILIHDY